ncbi:hypothetical protein ACJEC8_00100 [Candidatus Carsonella ruddii]|uniref:hypothetical protein n=1 Tax=Carsonella ruddii TaxID=114186 RepID=UPI003D3F5C94
MNINFTLINEIISFIFFFIFFLTFIFPKIIDQINDQDIYFFQNKIFLNYNKTFNNKLFKKIIFIEQNIKNNVKIIIEDINNILIKKIFFLKNSISIEKKFIINKIKKKIGVININFIYNFIYEIKIYFLKSFKKIYNEIINYNNDFILI